MANICELVLQTQRHVHLPSSHTQTQQIQHFHSVQYISNVEESRGYSEHENDL